jgi:hypothetical protein
VDVVALDVDAAVIVGGDVVDLAEAVAKTRRRSGAYSGHHAFVMLH